MKVAAFGCKGKFGGNSKPSRDQNNTNHNLKDYNFKYRDYLVSNKLKAGDSRHKFNRDSQKSNFVEKCTCFNCGQIGHEANCWSANKVKIERKTEAILVTVAMNTIINNTYENKDTIIFFIDSGSTDDFINDNSYLSNGSKFDTVLNVNVAKENTSLKATSVGKINIQCNDALVEMQRLCIYLSYIIICCQSKNWKKRITG